MTDDTAFLGVEASFTGRRWEARAYDERTALALSQRYDIPDVIARALSARGLGLDDAGAFLVPRLRDLMPNPSSFQDMDQAVDRFIAAVRAGETIAVFGDYDVDGGTSSALMLRLGRALGAKMRLYVPDRLAEGYGPNPAAMRLLREEGAALCVCVDCGTTAYEALTAARDVGLDVLVIDHHAAEPSLPPAVALINPNRLDDPSAVPFGALAAVGVTFLFCVAVCRALRGQNFFSDARPAPDLMRWLDLVALGTVCDVVRLTGLNRAFVTQGLKVMESAPQTGVRALMRAAGAKGRVDTYTAGFILGPRVNAGGRVGKSDLGARLLATDDEAEAVQLADALHALNAQRQEVEAGVLAEAERLMEEVDTEAPLIFAASEGWHPGVIGIVASRLKERYHRPAIVVALEGAEGKGSGRSVTGVDLGAAVIAARQAGLLLAGGGHKMAAGLTVARDQIAALQAFLSARIGKQMEAAPLRPSLSIDGLLGAQALAPAFLEKLAALAPFGTGNPEPRLAIADCKIIRADVVGEKHVSLIAMQGGTRLRAIAFRAMESDLGTALISSRGKTCHLAGYLRADDFRGGDAMQLVVNDAGGAAEGL